MLLQSYVHTTSSFSSSLNQSPDPQSSYLSPLLSQLHHCPFPLSMPAQLGHTSDPQLSLFPQSLLRVTLRTQLLPPKQLSMAVFVNLRYRSREVGLFVVGIRP